MVRDDGKHVAFPNENPILGRYLRVATDAGPAMTAKILKANGKLIYCSTYPGLLDSELASPAHIALREEFDANMENKWGPDCTPDDFPDVALENTPHYNKFNNVNVDLCHQDPEWLEWWRKFTGTDGEEGLLDGMDDESPVETSGIDSKLPTPEIGDHYIGASIIIARGSISNLDKVMSQKRDRDGNLEGPAHPNPIKDPPKLTMLSFLMEKLQSSRPMQ
jgi:hypothetical protein